MNTVWRHGLGFYMNSLKGSLAHMAAVSNQLWRCEQLSFIWVFFPTVAIRLAVNHVQCGTPSNLISTLTWIQVHSPESHSHLTPLNSDRSGLDLLWGRLTTSSRNFSILSCSHPKWLKMKRPETCGLSPGLNSKHICTNPEHLCTSAGIAVIKPVCLGVQRATPNIWGTSAAY